MKKTKYSINVKKLLSCIYNDKVTLTKFFAASFIIGIVIALTTPKKYTTSVVLAPEETNSLLSGGISSLASMVGMDIGTNMAGDAIYPEIYPDLMKSVDFVVSLFNIPVTTKDNSLNTTYYDYICHHQKSALLDYPIIGLSKLINLIKYGNLNEESKDVDPFKLTYSEYNVTRAISKQIDCSVDMKTRVISLSVTDQDPLISAVLADSVRVRLQKYITSYRTNKARNDLRFMERLYKEAKNDYDVSRKKYSDFCDANQGLVLQLYKSKEEDLENDMQLKFNIYSQVSQQLQMAKAKLQERTPAFTVLQMASVPVKASSFPRLFILIIILILGFITRLSILVYKNFDSLIVSENEIE